MHMLATNLCEWLYVLVEETRHEINNNPGNVSGKYYAKYSVRISIIMFHCTLCVLML